MITDLQHINHSYNFNTQRTNPVFVVIMLALSISCVTLPFIKLDVGVTAVGAIRPVGEKIVLRAVMPGIIESIHFSEGEFVNEGEVIFTTRGSLSESKLNFTRSELNEKQKQLQDLRLLSKSANPDVKLLGKLLTPVYQMQLTSFLKAAAIHNTAIRKSDYELHTATSLYRDSVISKSEFFRQQNESAKSLAENAAFLSNQKSSWEQELFTTQRKIVSLEQELAQYSEEIQLYGVRAPASGVLMNSLNKYTGSFIQTGESFGEITPETKLEAECYVSPSDIGLIKIDQPAIFQIDAFDHNYFGTVDGKVRLIDQDYTVSGNNTFYRIRCSISTGTFKIRDGYAASLKKGLTFRARFLVGKRSIAQLLFEKMENWFDPWRN